MRRRGARLRAALREVGMADRLSSLDVSFLYLEEPPTAMHTGSVMVFAEPSGGLDHERLVRHLAARIALVPRYRQRLRWVPGRLANPVWVDDEDFDLTYHVRRSALPRPGTRDQLEELVARLQSRRLDRRRPLWELIIVEGLEGGGFAVVTKVHQALVDGVQAVDLGQVVLDGARRSTEPPVHTWRPAPEPTPVELVAGAVADSIRRPRHLVETLRAGLGDVRVTAGKVVEGLGGIALAARTAARPTPRSPLNRDISEHRRFRMVPTTLADHQRVATAPGVDATVDDVVLATLTGALRAWLLARGELVDPGGSVRALVPTSVSGEPPDGAGAAAASSSAAVGSAAVGRWMTSLLVDLPTGEGDPLVRLHQVAYQTRIRRDAGQSVDAPTIAGIAGFAPPTLHSLGARLASSLSRHLFNLVISVVPGPETPLYLAGARMITTCPVVPLARGQALSVGLTTYDGGVQYGLFADRDAMSDLDVLARCIPEALTEILEAVT